LLCKAFAVETSNGEHDGSLAFYTHHHCIIVFAASLSWSPCERRWELLSWSTFDAEFFLYTLGFRSGHINLGAAFFAHVRYCVARQS
jgi:hypothetical protein